MDLISISGYIAAGLVFTTFCMRTMVPLRMVAILSNGAFIAYGLIGGLYPILVLHAVLLPLNVFRLFQIRRLVARVAEASAGDLSLDCLTPMMTRRIFAAGEVIFRRGDDANEVFFVVDGTVRVHELSLSSGPGALIGEIGVFSPQRKRTQTVSCETDVEAFSVAKRDIYELYFQNPELGLYITRLIITRMLENANATRWACEQTATASSGATSANVPVTSAHGIRDDFRASAQTRGLCTLPEIVTAPARDSGYPRLPTMWVDERTTRRSHWCSASSSLHPVSPGHPPRRFSTPRVSKLEPGLGHPASVSACMDSSPFASPPSVSGEA